MKIPTATKFAVSILGNMRRDGRCLSSPMMLMTRVIAEDRNQAIGYATRYYMGLPGFESIGDISCVDMEEDDFQIIARSHRA